MSSGSFPLEEKYSPAGKRLAELIDDLRAHTQSDAFPKGYENDHAEDGAADGYYEACIRIAIELLDRCVTRDSTGSSND